MRRLAAVGGRLRRVGDLRCPLFGHALVPECLVLLLVLHVCFLTRHRSPPSLGAFCRWVPFRSCVTTYDVLKRGRTGTPTSWQLGVHRLRSGRERSPSAS